MGDDEGRVNLMYLLLVYLVIPLIGGLVSVISLLRGKGLNVARVLRHLPFWSKTQLGFLHKLRQLHLEKPWFFVQSQAAALAYSLASLLVFMVLLLVTDLNFVWRSTVLNAENLFPVLKFIALPWFYLEAAQPSLDVLRATQDSRLATDYGDITAFGQWWPFVMATQIFYAFLLRSILLLIGKAWLRAKIRNDIEYKLNTQSGEHSTLDKPEFSLQTISHQLPPEYQLVNWAMCSDAQLSQLNLQPSHVHPINPLTLDETPNPTLSGAPQLVLVKAWEPPMGELFDHLQQGQGFLFPINIKANTLISPELKHLEEWQRFAKPLSNWTIYLPTAWTPENAQS